MARRKLPVRRRVDSCDRAFRALARAEPALIARFLAVTLPGVVKAGRRLAPEHVDDPHLDAGPHGLDADFLARLGTRELLHVEFQGYRETGFLRRLFRYHLASVDRYPDRRVQSVAVWLIRPPARQRCDRIVIGNVTVRVHAVVLPETSARLLLRHPELGCFAAGADAGAWSVQELCDRVVKAMRRAGATWNQWRVAGLVAMARGRYSEMVKAMQKTRVEPAVVIEFVEYGRERYQRGLRRGIKQGLQQGVEQARAVLLATLAARSIHLGRGEQKRIADESSLELLLRWVQRAAVARSAAEVFET